MILRVNDYHQDAGNQLLNNQQNNQTNSSVAHCPDSLARWYCLNGATCFRVLVEDSLLYNCLCRHGFHGARCEFKYTGGAASLRSSGSGNGTEQNETVHRPDIVGVSSDRMAALGLRGDDLSLSSRIQNVATSGRGGQQITNSLIERLTPSVLALVCCLIFMLVIAMCALLIERYFRGKRLPEPRRRRRRLTGRVSREIFDRLTLGQAKTANRQMSGDRARQVDAHATQPPDEQQVARKWDDTLRVERNLQKDYFCEHAIELARQATRSDTRDWEQRPTVAATAAVRQAACVSLSSSRPL